MKSIQMDNISASAVRVVAARLGVRRKKAIKQKVGCMLTWEDAHGYELTLHACAETIWRLRKQVKDLQDALAAKIDEIADMDGDT